MTRAERAAFLQEQLRRALSDGADVGYELARACEAIETRANARKAARVAERAILAAAEVRIAVRALHIDRVRPA